MSNRAIDRHEDAIVHVLDQVEKEGLSYIEALQFSSYLWDLPTDRLNQLVRCWCAIAGIEVPNKPEEATS
jgi:hypothetical protein